MNSRISLQQFKVFFFVQGLCALFLAAPSVVAAADTDTISIKDTNYPIPSDAYFVSPNGLDTNSGKSLNSPWTVAKAINSAPSGSTIVFRGGTYRNVNNSMIRKKLTLQAYPHEQAWIKGSTVVTGWSAADGIWQKDGWTYSFPQHVSAEFIDPKYPLAGYRDMVYIEGVSLKQVASKAEVVAGTFYVDSANQRLYIGNDPTGKIVEATALGEAFGIWKTGSFDPSNTVVRGLGFAHYANVALMVRAPGVQLENNTFAWMGAEGVSVAKPDAIIRGNTFSYNGRVGLRADRVHHSLVQDNTFSYNNIERFAYTWDAAGLKVTHTDGLIVRRNIIEYTYGTGLWMDSSSTNATLVSNTSRYNNIGIFFEASHQVIIAGNISHNNIYAGIMVSNASSARVYNNTLVNNSTNLKLKDTTRNNPNAEEANLGITWIARNHVFKNNILSNTTGGAFFDTSNCDTKEEASLMIDAADYNAYYRKSSSKPKTIVKWSLGASKCSTLSTSMNTFFATTGFEEHALVVDNVATNPFFVDEAEGNYRLKPGSPASARGQALPADIASAIGLPSGVPVDLGAIQSK